VVTITSRANAPQTPVSPFAQRPESPSRLSVGAIPMSRRSVEVPEWDPRPRQPSETELLADEISATWSVIRSPHGRKAHPAVAVVNAHRAALMRMIPELGLSPSARTRIVTRGAQAETLRVALELGAILHGDSNVVMGGAA